MRYYIRQIILSFLGRLKKPSKSIHILNGHYINNINTIKDKETFEALLDDLSKYFKLIRFEDACELIKTKQKVTIKSLDKTFIFNTGEKIHTETSRKYNSTVLQEILANTKLTILDKLLDSNQYFADYIVEKQ